MTNLAIPTLTLNRFTGRHHALKHQLQNDTYQAQPDYRVETVENVEIITNKLKTLIINDL